MSILKDTVAVTVNGHDITLHDIFYPLKIRTDLGLLRRAVRDYIVAQAVAREGVVVTPIELQTAADAFRRHNGLHKAADTDKWLKDNDLTLDDLETRLHQTLAEEKLLHRIITQQDIWGYFAEHRGHFDTVELSHIVVAQEGVAQELHTQITEEDEDFYTLARRYSIDEKTRDAGGYIGDVYRRDLSPQIEAAVLGAEEESVVGPIKTDQGYHLIMVEAIDLAVMDEATEEHIKNVLFETWLEQEISGSSVELKLMDLL